MLGVGLLWTNRASIGAALGAPIPISTDLSARRRVERPDFNLPDLGIPVERTPRISSSSDVGNLIPAHRMAGYGDDNYFLAVPRIETFIEADPERSRRDGYCDRPTQLAASAVATDPPNHFPQIELLQLSHRARANAADGLFADFIELKAKAAVRKVQPKTVRGVLSDDREWRRP
jgi:hypothetical protein